MRLDPYDYTDRHFDDEYRYRRPEAPEPADEDACPRSRRNQKENR